MLLTDRKKLILKALVDDYIATAEPVASKTLATRKEFDISSATIRKEMSELEEAGYLYHPHTSAGRIPTDLGYRVYVDKLMKVPELAVEEVSKAKVYFEQGREKIDHMLEGASKLLAESTGYVSLTLPPSFLTSKLKQVKTLLIEPGKALIVLVLEEGMLKDRLVRLPLEIKEEDLESLALSLNKELKGKTLDEISSKDLTEAGQGMESKALSQEHIKKTLYEIYLAMKMSDKTSIYVNGSHNILSYPEFANPQRAKNLFGLLSERKTLAGYMDLISKNFMTYSLSDGDDAGSEGFYIRIGGENVLEDLKDYSFVTAIYSTGINLRGSLGVIGPKRMDYGKVISSIDFVRAGLNRELERLCAQGCDSLLGLA